MAASILAWRPPWPRPRPRTRPHLHPAARILRGPRRGALATIAVIVAAASLTSFAESYRGLFLFALHHGVPDPWAAVWPLMVDSFIAVGELALFVALADQWALRGRLGAWAVILLGLAVSVAGNIAHVTIPSPVDRATAAVPPLAAAMALAVGLGVLKRVAAQHQADHHAAARPRPRRPSRRTGPRPRSPRSARLSPGPGRPSSPPRPDCPPPPRPRPRPWTRPPWPPPAPTRPGSAWPWPPGSTAPPPSARPWPPPVTPWPPKPSGPRSSATAAS